ncbi:Radical SAM, Pyruvate-formate lyase-activating enzyme like [Desulfurella amilsii]|uniref:Radical SAM, Pyruvate-formate lyase-activating enzyme like n=1 Tax=Desulfurella amilsii TaxID=1562698 RepID=A0A1X4XVW6_9BACT|nr:AmmeMemoRadiSam system radical SAM enzyme [Desulfurella amilsii]OSS41670.1 Radical SAM, Pyruvate-formate lyase-activating enzyme like [Desulfurella amilsii]
MKEAYLYKQLNNKKVRCDLCSHRCVIEENQVGICKVRKNINGKLYSLVYEKVIAQAVDPIEKKPLYHFLPGSKSYSIATVGCNFTCLNCQNYEISQYMYYHDEPAGKYYSVNNVVSDAIFLDCSSISYTYTEPTVFFEYAIDCAYNAKLKGLKNVFVTNGFFTKQALDKMTGLIDAVNIDLKSMSESFYKNIAGGRLKPVLNSIEYSKGKGIWVEITTLVMPTLNDTDDEIEKIARFIKSIDVNIPWHISAFYPTYKLTNIGPTSIKTIQKAYEIGKSVGLRYVYGGNITKNNLENTYCYNCGELLIERNGFAIIKNTTLGNRCPKCNAEIAGVL